MQAFRCRSADSSEVCSKPHDRMDAAILNVSGSACQRKNVDRAKFGVVRALSLTARPGGECLHGLD